jgi:hypothetical protein
MVLFLAMSLAIIFFTSSTLVFLVATTVVNVSPEKEEVTLMVTRPFGFVPVGMAVGWKLKQFRFGSDAESLNKNRYDADDKPGTKPVFLVSTFPRYPIPLILVLAVRRLADAQHVEPLRVCLGLSASVPLLLLPL